MVAYLQENIVLLGTVASLGAGLATAVGALPIFFTRTVSARYEDAMLGFAAGVMLAATSFSLVLPAIEYGNGGVRGAAIAVLSLLLGAIFVDLIDMYSPHRHFLMGPEGTSSSLARIWLFVIAITIHNFPEGLAVGVGFGGGDITNGLTLATGIGLQNVPEGLAVALALSRENYKPIRAFGVAALSGLVEPIGGLIGVWVVHLSSWILPIGMGFAAGAMLFVISDEIIPETHRRGFERIATYAVVVGFVLMTFLDNTLG